jgi:DNA polymerase family A
MKTELVVGDFETFWSDTHSLSKMSALEYVMSPKTELISLALKKEGKSVCVFGEKNIRELVSRIDWSNKLLVAHNNSEFDALIFAFRLGVKPKMWGCTLAMARPIHAKDAGGSLSALVEHYGLGKKDASALIATKGKHLKDFTTDEIAAMRTYNMMDTEQCYNLFYKLLPQTPKSEMKLIDATIRMLVEPQFVLDEPLLVKTLELEQYHKRDMLIGLAARLGAASVEDVRKTLASAPKFSAFLEANGVPVPMKLNPKGKSIPALAKTDEGFIALTEHDDELVATAAQTRLGVKSTQLETRIIKLLDAAHHCNGRIPVPIKYYGADTTGRWSGFWYNLQNLTRILKSKPKLSDALRYSLKAPPGYKVVVADLSGIELRVNMTLWKVPYATEMLAADAEADLYKPLASEVLGVPIEDMPKMVRQAGKAMHLGCFAPDTKVVTNNGVKRIVEVLATDMVWDGESWATHDGVVPQGRKAVQTQYGVTATSDHEILTERGWARWSEVCESHHLFQSAIRRGSWSSSRGNVAPIPAKQGITRGFGVLAGGKDLLTAIISRSAQLLGVIPVPNRLRRAGLNGIGSTQTWFRMTRTARDCLTAYLLPLAGVMGVQTRTAHTRFAASPCAKSGARTERSSCATLSLPPDGMFRNTTWTESTTTKGTRRGIFGSLAAGIIATTSALSQECRRGLTPSKQNSLVYDLANCGKRHRFTIVTDYGPILVHNCGFGLGSAEKYVAVAKQMAQIVVTPEEAERHIAGYRNKHPEVVRGWKTCHRALDYIYSGTEAQIDPWGLCHTSKEGIVTPRGVIRYPELRKEVNEETGKTEWVYGTGRRKARIHGPKCDENCVQHLARNVLADNMLDVQRQTGYWPVHTVHDELIYIVPEDQAQLMLDTVQAVMRTSPVWWPELVVHSEGSIGDNYGEAK